MTGILTETQDITRLVLDIADPEDGNIHDVEIETKINEGWEPINISVVSHGSDIYRVITYRFEGRRRA